jgi:hypothetical protein
MPFRLLKYMTGVWEQHHEQHSEDHPFPCIVPVVLYHGNDPWRVPRFFSQMLNMPADLGFHPPELEYILIDLSKVPDQLLMERLEIELSLSLFRHIRDEGFLDFFRRIIGLLAELRSRKTGLEYIETILRYVYYVRSEDEWDGVVDLLRQADPVIQEVAMRTIAQHLMEQGEARGEARGEIKGLEKGKIHEAHDVLIELLEEQFGVIPLSLTEKLQQVQSYELLRMLRRQRKTCQSLDDFARLLQRALQ